MVNYTQVLQQTGLTEAELPEVIQKDIAKYKRCLMDAENIKASRKFEYFNKNTNSLTKKGQELVDTAIERAEDYNERIIDEISEFIDNKQDNIEKSKTEQTKHSAHDVIEEPKRRLLGFLGF